MRLDEDYLRELELWPLFEMREALLAPVAEKIPATSTTAATKSLRPPSPVAAAYTARPVAPTAPQAMRPSIAQTTVAVVKIDPERAARIARMDESQLQTEVAFCQACDLCKRRKQVVFGIGAVPSRWLFVGEAPGADEDEIGEPFVGQAGKLLDAMLKAIKLQRGHEVYIANVVKCRPPGNRTPTFDEATACAPFLDRQIALIQPNIIVALGKTAALRLTGKDISMAQLRGTKYDYQGIPLVVTYHPSYLLRTATEKAKAWEDLLFATRVALETA